MPDNSKEIHQLPDLGDVQRGDVLAASRNGKTGRVSLDASGEGKEIGQHVAALALPAFNPQRREVGGRDAVVFSIGRGPCLVKRFEGKQSRQGIERAAIFAPENA